VRMLRGEPEDSRLGELFCGLNHREPETIMLDCPIGCLKFGLSDRAFYPLEQAAAGSFLPTRTVRDVVELHKRGQLKEIRGLGQRRIGEIEVALIYMGVQ
jgi:hypothetical protein